jgi:hypothetical protein
MRRRDAAMRQHHEGTKQDDEEAAHLMVANTALAAVKASG